MKQNQWNYNRLSSTYLLYIKILINNLCHHTFQINNVIVKDPIYFFRA